jgi:MFS family permease
MAHKISKDVKLLGVTSLFTDFASEMIFPILPIFLTVTLGAPVVLVGLIEGVAESTASILKTFSGYISDKLRMRKALVIKGYTLSALTKPILALSVLWQHVLIARFLDRVGKGVREAPRDALIASSNSHERGRAFGLHRAFDTSGAVLGNLAAFLLLSKFVAADFRTIFWIALIPAILSVFFIFPVKESRPRKVKEKVKFSFKPFSKRYKKFVAIASLFYLGNFSYAFFILKAADLGVVIAFIPLVYLAYNVFYAGFSYPVGIFSDKVSKRNVLASGYFTFFLLTALFAFTTKQYYVWLLFPLYGVFKAITDGVSRAFVSDLTPDRYRATGLGLYQTSIGLAILPASIIAGLLWDIISPQATFLFASALSLLATILLLALIKKK